MLPKPYDFLKMNINWIYFLNKTKLRDAVVFFAVTLLVSFLLQITVYAFMVFSFKKVILSLILIGQFYVAAFVTIPVRNKIIRRILYVLFFAVNYFVFREFILAFTPKAVSRLYNLELIIGMVFMLSLFSRGIRMYHHLQEQLIQLNSWTQKKILFRKPGELELNLGREGNMKIHPNELVYIRTKVAGDHTKVFGIKLRQPKGVNARLAEYETTTYRNFEQVFRLLRPFPQFERIHQSAIINTTYPFQAKGGVLNIEGRRFTVSKNLK